MTSGPAWPAYIHDKPLAVGRPGGLIGLLPALGHQRHQGHVLLGFLVKQVVLYSTLIKKKIEIFLKYKEIQMGSVAKLYCTYMRKAS